MSCPCSSKLTLQSQLRCVCYGFAHTHLLLSLVSSQAQSCLMPWQQVAEILEALGSWFSLYHQLWLYYRWGFVLLVFGLQPGEGFFVCMFVFVFVSPLGCHIHGDFDYHDFWLINIISSVSFESRIMKQISQCQQLPIWLALLSFFFLSFLALFHVLSPSVIFKGNADANSCHL